MAFCVRASLASLVTAAALSGCSADNGGSHTNDIFTEDQGDAKTGTARRHPATIDDALWTVFMVTDGELCSGHLVSPDTMMSASHCHPRAGVTYSSGYALGQRQKDDITVTQVIEDNAQLDYSLMTIRWASGSAPAQQQFPPLIATKASDIVLSSRDVNKGDEIFTVGFPGDKVDVWGATYSEGRAKATDTASTVLFYDMGIINGNSGGGVWRKSDKMLLSLANQGPHSLNQPGWNTASINSTSATNNWNYGPGMWQIYAASKTLQGIFPGGKNRYAKTADVSKALWMALGEPDSSVAATFTLYVSAPKTATKLIFCQTSSADTCDANAAGYTTATLVKTIGDQAVFKAARSTTVSDGLTLSVKALDDQSRTVAARSMQVKVK